ncbi:MAG: L-histidine N(alpha)-methyltransferase [bacterium]|nr:L-histidine N(alpha)-methyltransferase [bacterium]
MGRRTMDDRLQFRHYESAEGQSTFEEDVRRGLSSNPKHLSPKYFYDSLGSHLFEAICHLPEYYLTKTERRILIDKRDSILDVVDGDGEHRLVELGSGSSTKTRLLIEAFLERQEALHYLPVDISHSVLERSALELLQDYPDLRITALAADYSTALEALARDDDLRTVEKPTLVTFLGSSIGNFEPPASRALLTNVREVLRAGDSVLLGADLKKSEERLTAAYNDELGVTAAFNLNLLVRINRELGGEFRLADFEHRAVYNAERGRIEMWLISRRAHGVPICRLDMTVRFERGEPIHTENSYKFDPEQIRELAVDTGFGLQRSWVDEQQLFSVNLLRAGD